MTARLRPILFARYPIPGACKTRLIPAIGPIGAAEVHRRLVERAVARLAALSPIVAFTGAGEDDFRAWLGDDVGLVGQPSGDLGARMIAAGSPGPAIIVGSDIPDLTARAVEAAMARLEEDDIVLGPAEDGGFWLIGWRQARPGLFENVEWGSAHAREQVETNATMLGLSVGYTTILADLDRPEDLDRWPDLAP